MRIQRKELISLKQIAGVILGIFSCVVSSAAAKPNIVLVFIDDLDHSVLDAMDQQLSRSSSASAKTPDCAKIP